MAVTPTYVPSSFVQQTLAGYLAVDGATAVPASAANPLPVTGAVTTQPTTLPAFVATSGTAYDFTRYGSV